MRSSSFSRRVLMVVGRSHVTASPAPIHRRSSSSIACAASKPRVAGVDAAVSYPACALWECGCRVRLRKTWQRRRGGVDAGLFQGGIVAREFMLGQLLELAEKVRAE